MPFPVVVLLKSGTSLKLLSLKLNFKTFIPLKPSDVKLVINSWVSPSARFVVSFFSIYLNCGAAIIGVALIKSPTTADIIFLFICILSLLNIIISFFVYTGKQNRNP